MRRIMDAVGGAAAGLAMLLTFKSYTGASAVSTTGGTGAAGAAASRSVSGRERRTRGYPGPSGTGP